MNRLASRRSVALVICALALLAAGIRAVGIAWDSPFSLHPDEGHITQPAHGLLTTGKMRPKRVGGGPAYVYPPLLAEILALECMAFHPFSNRARIRDVPAATVRMAGRATTLAAGVLSVVLVALMARRLTGSLGVGALAGAVLALSPLHAESSRYATTDVLAGLWVLLAAWAAVRIVDEGRWRHYVFGAVAAGAAAATSYLAGVSFVLIVAAHLCRPGIFRSCREQWKVAAAALFAVATVLVALPPGFVSWPALIRGVGQASGHAGPGFQSPHPALDAVRILLVVGLGETATAVGLALFRGATSRRHIVPLVVLVGVTLGALGLRDAFVARDLLHVLPAALLLASWGFARGLDLARRAGWAAAAALAVAVLLPVGLRAGAQVRALAVGDNRLLARDWIARNVAPGSKVARAGGPASLHVPLRGLGLSVESRRHPKVGALSKRGVRWLVYSDGSDFGALRSPDRFPKESAAALAWLEQVRRRGKVVQHFPRRPLPGAQLPGSMAALVHQPDVLIVRVDPSPRKRRRGRERPPAKIDPGPDNPAAPRYKRAP